MMLEPVRSPAAFLNLMLGPRPEARFLRDYASWWETEGRPISDAVDRAGTPWLRMFDEFGNRIDEMLYPPDYRRMLEHGYRAVRFGRLSKNDRCCRLMNWAISRLSTIRACIAHIRFRSRQRQCSKNTVIRP